MKRSFSLNKIMHNDRLMILLSIIISIAIWAGVVYGPSVTETKTITVPITVKLNTTAEAGENRQDQYYHVIKQSEKSVSVTVSGNRSVLSKLSEKDLLVAADLSNEVKAISDVSVRLVASKINGGADFTIVGSKPQAMTVSCDYVGVSEYQLNIDATKIKNKDTSQYLLGTASADISFISINGPQAIRDQISRVVAVVESKDPLTETKVIKSKIVCYDMDNNRISDAELSSCEFVETGGPEVQVTIPVYAYRKVSISPKLKNIPAGYENVPNLVTLSPGVLEFHGTNEGVAALEKTLTELSINFDNISQNTSFKVPLSIPAGVSVTNDIQALDGTLHRTNLASKTITVPLDTSFTRRGTTLASDNLTVINVPADRNVSISKSSLSVTVVGSAYSLNYLKSSDIKLTIDLANGKNTGLNIYPARASIKRFTNLWAYYGSSGHGLDVYVTVQ